MNIITITIALVLFGLCRLTDNMIEARPAQKYPGKDQKSFL